MATFEQLSTLERCKKQVLSNVLRNCGQFFGNLQAQRFLQVFFFSRSAINSSRQKKFPQLFLPGKVYSCGRNYTFKHNE